MPATIRMGSHGPPLSPEEAGRAAPGPDVPSGDEETHDVPASGGRAPADGAADRHARECPTCGTVFSGSAQFCPFDGEPLRELPAWRPEGDPLVGLELAGRYRIERLLGEGGMGKVFAARHLAIDRRCAIKVLKRELARERDTVERFLQEARVTAGLEHPGIVAVTDFGEIGDDELPGLGAVRLPWFVMELLEGESLAQRLQRERPLAPREVATIGRACAEALACAHGRGVVHRDLKPDNVFLARRENGPPRVVLLDFGVAQVASASRRTRRGMTFGTPHYMSPEQATARALDGRSDLYALGVILYECLAGVLPFTADTFMGVLTKHVAATPEPLERHVDRARLGTLGDVVARCLEKDPDARHESAERLAADLGRVERAVDVDAATVPVAATDARRRPSSSPLGRGPGERNLPDAAPGPAPRSPARTVTIGLLVAATVAGAGAVARAVALGDGARTPAAASADPAAAIAAPAGRASAAAPAASMRAEAAAAASASAAATPVASAAETPPRLAGRAPSRPPRAAPTATSRASAAGRSPGGTGEVKDPWAD